MITKFRPLSAEIDDLSEDLAGLGEVPRQPANQEVNASSDSQSRKRCDMTTVNAAGTSQ